jgi:hypothetical protein
MPTGMVGECIAYCPRHELARRSVGSGTVLIRKVVDVEQTAHIRTANCFCTHHREVNHGQCEVCGSHSGLNTLPATQRRQACSVRSEILTIIPTEAPSNSE